MWLLLRQIGFLVLRKPSDRRHAGLLVLAMLFAAAFEALGVGLIMPFVALIQNPRIVETSRALQAFRSLSGAETEAGLLYAFGIALAGIFLLKNVYLAIVQWLQFRFIYSRQVALGSEVVGRYLGNPYTFHLQHNSSELIQSVMLEIHLITNHVLVSLFTVIVELLTVVVILGAMVFVEPLLVPIVGSSIAAVAFIFYRSVQRKSLTLGEQEKAHQANMIKWLQQGLGGIKEAQVMGVERFFLDSFTDAATGLGRAEAKHRLTVALPRYLLESLGMIALVLISLGMIARGRASASVLPVLGVLAVAAVRLLPSASRILASLTDLRHNVPAVTAIYSTLTGPDTPRVLPKEPPAPKAFEQTLRVSNVAYRYPNAPQSSLSDVSLEIRRGESIAIVGGSGAGKTTMTDVLIGLLEPTKGTLEVDGEPLSGKRLLSWRRSVGYIPQQVYLCDDSVLRNVAYGVEDSKIDRERVNRAIDAARLRELVDSMPDGLDTFVGERGVRLSGGQRQRIGIARALYLDPEILVLDEATSSLDGKTEQEIVEAIERIRSDRTAIIIAHRLSTVRGCERLVFMRDGRIAQVGSWDELYAGNADFRHLVKLAEREDTTNGASKADKSAKSESQELG